MPKLAPTLLGGTLAAIITSWAIFIGLAWLAGSNVGILPRFNSLSPPVLADLIRSTVTATGVFAGIFALVYAYRKQRIDEAAGRRADAEALGKRYHDAIAQLGHDSPAVRLGGVYALSRLADDDELQRPTIVSVLCSYLRMPYSPADGISGEREVRHAIIGTIAEHLRDAASPINWCGKDLDFSGATFDGGSFDHAKFTGGRVSFEGAKFVDGRTSFNRTEFSGAHVSFGDGTADGASVNAGEVSFIGASFTGGIVSWIFAEIKNAGTVLFAGANFAESASVSFSACHVLDNGSISFGDYIWSGSTFRDGNITFAAAKIGPAGHLDFVGIEMTGGELDFEGVKLDDGLINFNHARITGGSISFADPEALDGGISFTDAEGMDQFVSPWPIPQSRTASTAMRSQSLLKHMRVPVHWIQKRFKSR